MNTDETEISNFLPIPEATLVYSGNHTFSNDDDNWSDIIFDECFEYSGSNLLVAVLMKRAKPELSDYNYNGTSRFYGVSSSEKPNMCVAMQSDFEEYFINENGIVNRAYGSRTHHPNIILGINKWCSEIEIIGTNGQQVASYVVSDYAFTSDMSNYKAGMYLIKVYFGEKNTVVKAVVKR